MMWWHKKPKITRKDDWWVATIKDGFATYSACSKSSAKDAQHLLVWGIDGYRVNTA